MKTIAIACCAVLFAASIAAAQSAAASCDKGCLLSTADAYLAALVAHDASKAPMAPNAKFTEQTKVLKVGEEGLWKSALSVSPTFKIPVPDPLSQQIGMIVMMKAQGSAFPAPPPRGGGPAPDPNAPADIQLALRLKVENRKITEAEHIIARIAAPNQLNALKTPRAAFSQVVPPGQRDKRNILLLIGNAYYDALTQNNGELAPFAADCGRRENGITRPAWGAPPMARLRPQDLAARRTTARVSSRRVR
jgi:hypothetical protein